MAATDGDGTGSGQAARQPGDRAYDTADTKPPQRTHNVNVRAVQPLASPQDIREDLPNTSLTRQLVVDSREVIKSILDGRDDRLLAIVGPCSIHDEKAALEYADRLAALAREVADQIYVVMRVYFEKPRTTVGWKGLINDPHLDGTFAIDEGLRVARRMLLEIVGRGLPAATEMLDPITPQYIADLVSWAAIGARTTESQTHREMASGLSMPIGFKNSTDSNVQVAVDAMKSALHPHNFLGIDEQGRTAIFRTSGNKWGHIILRGGRQGPNYHPECVFEAAQRMRDAGLEPRIAVDCSHANSNKRHAYQEVAWRSVVRQRAAGSRLLVGAMLESNLFEGSQAFEPGQTELRYGVSVTDACIGWEKTEELVRDACRELS